MKCHAPRAPAVGLGGGSLAVLVKSHDPGEIEAAYGLPHNMIYHCTSARLPF